MYNYFFVADKFNIKFFFIFFAGDLGISEQDHIVVYDSVGLFSSTRVYWTFKVFYIYKSVKFYLLRFNFFFAIILSKKAFCHDKVSVLDGGLPKWIAEKREVESGPVSFAVII